jgi:two-component system invasion response regulator UvrY
MNNTNITKVCLVDDHVLLRNALAVLIDKSGSCQVIAQASNGRELTEILSEKNKPDVILLDMNMPIMDGHETSIWLKKNYPEIKVLMLTMYDSEIALIRLLQVGVVGFMKKDVHPNEMINAIHLVLSQGFYYSANTSSKLAGLFRDTNDTNSLLYKVMLDSPEIEFLKLVCTEMTYKEIALHMKLNPRSIDTIRDSLFTRLDVKSRVGLAMYAIRHGIVNP